MFEYDIDAAFTGDTAHLVANFLRFVIDEMVSAKKPGLLKFLIRACGNNHARSKELGDLNGSGANTTACPQNEHIFTWLNLRATNQHVPCGLKDQRNGSGFFEREIFRIRHAVDFGNADEFSATPVNQVTKIRELAATIILAGDASRAFPASDAGSENHFLAHFDGVYVRAYFRDFTGDVAAGNVRQWNRNTGKPAADP